MYKKGLLKFKSFKVGMDWSCMILIRKNLKAVFTADWLSCTAFLIWDYVLLFIFLTKSFDFLTCIPKPFDSTKLWDNFEAFYERMGLHANILDLIEYFDSTKILQMCVNISLFSLGILEM